MKRWMGWVLVVAALLCAAGLVLWYQKANESASPEVRRLAAVRPTRPPVPPPESAQPAQPSVAPIPAVIQPNPRPTPSGVISIQAIRDNVAAFLGKEVTVLGVVRRANYGEGIKDCAFTYQIEDSTSRAWVLPCHRTTPDLGRSARVKATVAKDPDRPWSSAYADSMFLLEKSWTYEK
jgi:hypothetical protein